MPEIVSSDLVADGSGVRAQAVRPDGSMVDDFQFVQADKMLHVWNVPSPAATASLPIGSHIVEMARKSDFETGHPERSSASRSEDATQSKDPFQLSKCAVSDRSQESFAPHHLNADVEKLIGVLRLRGCFAPRSSHSAQDDSPVDMKLYNC